MNGKIVIWEIATGKKKIEILLDSTKAVNLLKRLPDQCPQDQAAFAYEVYTVHHGGITSEIGKYYTTKYQEIDWDQPFGAKYRRDEVCIILDKDNKQPAGSAVVRHFDVITGQYIVDITYPGSDTPDKNQIVDASQLIKAEDIVKGAINSKD